MALDIGNEVDQQNGRCHFLTNNNFDKESIGDSDKPGYMHSLIINFASID